MNIFRKLIENARRGYKESEIEDRLIMRGEVPKEFRKPEIKEKIVEEQVKPPESSEGKKLCIGCLAEMEKTANYCPVCGRSQLA